GIFGLVEIIVTLHKLANSLKVYFLQENHHATELKFNRGLICLGSISKDDGDFGWLFVQYACCRLAARDGPVIRHGYAGDLSSLSKPFGNYAISGGVKGIEVVEAKAKFFKARMTVRLALAGALHTSFMQPAVSRLEPALAATEIRTPRIPVISNVDAQPHSDPDTIKLQADFSAA
ncbi:hypothetical protein ACJX0J_038429, partial [Zea mays]